MAKFNFLTSGTLQKRVHRGEFPENASKACEIKSCTVIGQTLNTERMKRKKRA